MHHFPNLCPIGTGAILLKTQILIPNYLGDRPQISCRSPRGGTKTPYPYRTGVMISPGDNLSLFTTVVARKLGDIVGN